MKYVEQEWQCPVCGCWLPEHYKAHAHSAMLTDDLRKQRWAPPVYIRCGNEKTRSA